MSRGQGALALAALVAACLGSGAEIRPGTADEAATSAIAALRFEGRLDDALALARRLRADLARDGAPAWRQEDIMQEVATIERLRELPDSTRRTYMMSDSAARGEERSTVLDAARARQALWLRLRTRLRVLGARHPEVADAASAIARFEYEQGYFVEAYRLEQWALENRRQALGEQHPAFANSLESLGLYLKSAHGTESSVHELYRRSFAIRSALLGPESLPAMQSLQDLANLERTMLQFDASIRDLREVVRVREQALDPDDPQSIDALTDLGLTLTTAGRWVEAEAVLERAVSGCVREHRVGGAEFALALNTQGIVLERLSRLAEAESVLTLAARVQEVRRRDAISGLGRAYMFSLPAYEDLACVLVQEGRAERAWLSFERGLGRTLLEGHKVGDGPQDSDPWGDLLARVQNALPDSTALVGWLDPRNSPWAPDFPFWGYVVRHRGPPHWIRISRTDTSPVASSSRVRSLAQDLRTLAEWPLQDGDRDELAREAREVGALRMDPLLPYLRDVNTIIVVPQGSTFDVPVGLLRDPSDRPFLDRFAIAYAPSALLWLAEHERGAIRVRDTRCMLLGNVDETPGPDASGDLPGARSELAWLSRRLPRAPLLQGRGASAAALRKLARDGSLQRLDVLHLALHSDVDPRWQGAESLVFSSVRARETRSRKRGAGDLPAGVGLAGSAVTSTLQPPADVQPLLAAIEPATPDDRLGADEIARSWRLSARLVCLASCRTALGFAARGEGDMGLAHALLQAGARSVLVSEWAVDDSATSMLLERFYDLWLGRSGTGQPAALALRESQEWLRDWRAPDGTHPYRSPIYWAGFAVIGAEN